MAEFDPDAYLQSKQTFDPNAYLKAAPSHGYSGGVLPFTKDAEGHVSFDSNAGIVGMAKRLLEGAYSAATIPGDVYSGKTPIVGQDGETSPEVINRSAELASFATPISAAARAGESVIPGIANSLVRQEVKPPTTQELAKAGIADIKSANAAPVAFRPEAIAGLSQKIQQDLVSGGVHPVLAKNTFDVLKELENAPPGSYATLPNLQSLRETLSGIAQNRSEAYPKDQLAASRAIQGLDGFLPNATASDVLVRTSSPGLPATGQQIANQNVSTVGQLRDIADQLQRGRANYAAAMRSNDITGGLDRAKTGILERAEGRAQAANSGRNLDNTIRQKVEALLEKPKEVSGFSNDELSALNDVVEGGKVRNAARYVGNLLGGGGGIGQAGIAIAGGGTGAAVGGLPGLAVGLTPAATGTTAKMLANALAKRSLNAADEVVRSNSPLYREMADKAPLVPSNLGRNAALAKALLMSAMQGHSQE